MPGVSQPLFAIRHLLVQIASFTLLAWLPALPVLAADFPELKQQIDATRRPLGVGTCATYRTGVWLADGGVVVEIQKPSRCMFESLELVVDGRRYPSLL